MYADFDVLMMVVFGCILFGLPILCSILDSRDIKRLKEKLSKERDLFLKEQSEKPKYRVLVLTKTGKTLETEPFHCESEMNNWYFGWQLFNHTSYEKAQNYTRAVISKGYFVDNDDVFVPMCEIEALKVVQCT